METGDLEEFREWCNRDRLAAQGQLASMEMLMSAEDMQQAVVDSICADYHRLTQGTPAAGGQVSLPRLQSWPDHLALASQAGFSSCWGPGGPLQSARAILSRPDCSRHWPLSELVWPPRLGNTGSQQAAVCAIEAPLTGRSVSLASQLLGSGRLLLGVNGILGLSEDCPQTCVGTPENGSGLVCPWISQLGHCTESASHMACTIASGCS